MIVAIAGSGAVALLIFMGLWLYCHHSLQKVHSSTMADASICQVDFTAIICRGKEENWLLCPQDVHLEACVGAGGFGQVFRGSLYGACPIEIKVAKDAKKRWQA